MEISRSMKFLDFWHTRRMLQPLFPSSNVSGSHPDGRCVQNEYGDIPLHFALRHPCIVCFRAVLHSGNVDVTTMQDLNEETALHLSTEKTYWSCCIVGVALLQPWACHYSWLSWHDGFTTFRILRGTLRNHHNLDECKSSHTQDGSILQPPP
jgi:hypothetical protein